MTRDRRPFDSELEALLERGRIIRRVPDVVRARAVARARATAAVAENLAPAQASPTRGRALRIALAASVVLALGAAGTAAALLGKLPHRPEPAPPSSPPAVRPARIPAPGPQTIAPAPTSIAKPERPARPATAQESYAAELRLLQRAQAAYTGRDFTSALVLVAEHGRWFPNGRLAEQREALRVRSLAGSGRADEARLAVAAFARRFPRSVLVPRLQETARAAE